MKLKTILFVILNFITLLYSGLPDKNNIYIFPDPEEGYKRYVVEVFHMPDENICKVELQIGKNIYSDCNEYKFEGKVEVKFLENNETYLYIPYIGKANAITSRQCNERKKDKFVFLSISDELWKKYNSAIPIVIYVPKEYEVRYRMWKSRKFRQKATNR